MIIQDDERLPASRCPHCSGEFEANQAVSHCPDCGYVAGNGAD